MSRLPDFASIMKKRFGDEIIFFKGLLDSPRGVGALLPTSPLAARSMASIVDPDSDLPVLELGAGTGVVTRAILKRGIKPPDLYSIEYSDEFIPLLRKRFPRVNVIQGDAFDLDAALGEHRSLRFGCVVCAIPLVNFPKPQRLSLIRDLLDRMAPGRPVLALTYSPVSPVRPKNDEFTVTHHDLVLRNVPPANLWVYRRGL